MARVIREEWLKLAPTNLIWRRSGYWPKPVCQFPSLRLPTSPPICSTQRLPPLCPIWPSRAAACCRSSSADLCNVQSSSFHLTILTNSKQLLDRQGHNDSRLLPRASYIRDGTRLTDLTSSVFPCSLFRPAMASHFALSVKYLLPLPLNRGSTDALPSIDTVDMEESAGI